MSVADNFMPGPVFSVGQPRGGPEGDSASKEPRRTEGETKVRHRIAEVRHQQGVSVRSAARRMACQCSRSAPRSARTATCG